MFIFVIILLISVSYRLPISIIASQLQFRFIVYITSVLLIVLTDIIRTYWAGKPWEFYLSKYVIPLLVLLGVALLVEYGYISEMIGIGSSFFIVLLPSNVGKYISSVLPLENLIPNQLMMTGPNPDDISGKGKGKAFISPSASETIGTGETYSDVNAYSGEIDLGKEVLNSKAIREIKQLEEIINFKKKFQQVKQIIMF